MFEVYFSSKNMVWEFPGATDWGEGDGGNVALHYSFNVYQEFGRGFITQVGITPSVRFIPTNLNDPNASRIADSADALRRKIEIWFGGVLYAGKLITSLRFPVGFLLWYHFLGDFLPLTGSVPFIDIHALLL